MGTQERFGQALVELGLVDPSNLAELIATQRKTGRRLGPLVVEAGLLLEERYLPALARHVGLDRVDPTKAPIHRRVLDLVPASIARRHHVIPVARRKEDGLDRIVVAIADPFDDEAAAAVTAALPDGATPGWLLAGDSEIDQALATYYDQSQPPPLKAAPQSPVEGHETEPGNVRMGGSAAVYFDEDGTEVAAPQDPTASAKPSATVSRTPPERSLSGKSLGEWRLDKRVGVAGTSELYLATGPDQTQRLLRRLLPSIPVNDRTVTPFLGEAKKMVGLSHPNLIQVIETGEMEGRPHVVEEWIESRDLERALAEAKKRHAKLPIELAYYVASQILRALDYAHREAPGAPIIHRQLSPSRIKLTHTGQVRVSDFGVPASMLGAHSYHAPEQLNGQPGEAAADVFAVGLLFYELLCGEQLYATAPKTSVEASARARQLEELVAQKRPDAPASALKLLRVALAENPARRFPGARDFLNDLDAARAQLPAAGADELLRFLETVSAPEEDGPGTRASTIPLRRLSSIGEEVAKAMPRAETISAKAETLLDEVKRVFNQLMVYLDRFPVPQRVGLIGLVVFVVAIIPAVVVRSAVKARTAQPIVALTPDEEAAITGLPPEAEAAEVAPLPKKEIAPGVFDEPAPKGHAYIQKSGAELRATNEGEGEVLLWLDVGQIVREIETIDGRILVMIPPRGPAGFLDRGLLGPQKPLERLGKELGFKGCEVGSEGIERCLYRGKEQRETCEGSCAQRPGTRCVEACAAAFELCAVSCRDTEDSQRTPVAAPPVAKKKVKRR